MSWKKVKLGDLCTIEKGKTGIQKAIPGEYPLVVTAEDRKSHNEYQFDDEAVIIPLVSGTGHGHASIKRLHFQSGKFALGSILCAVIPKDKTVLNTEYLFRFLNLNKERELVDRMKGMANVTLPIKEIAKIEIPLPSLEEQMEFVEKYALLETDSEDISSELTHQLDLIKQLRQSFLREAMQGKLLCHAELVSASQQTGQQLLAKIKAEKAQLIAEKKLKKEKPLPVILAEEIPFEIPEHWVWCKIDKLVTSLSKDIRTGPFGTSLQKHEHKKEGVPVWGIESISKDGKFTKRNKIYVSDEKANQLKSFEVKGRDLIISRSGTIGELCMLPTEIEYGLISTNLMKISVNQQVILPEFFCHIIKGGAYITKMLEEFCSGSTRLFITQKILSKLIFPLPPLHEQEQIVAKLEELMAFCDGLEQSIKESQGYNEMLLQQVLREALQGEEV
jgi:type I restriction enzyme S subunit